jgi:hypothetical protein
MYTLRNPILRKPPRKVSNRRLVLELLTLNLESKMKGLYTNVDPRKQKKSWLKNRPLQAMAVLRT